MTEDQNRKRVRGSDLNQFERNRFFFGKLMSARDMQAEQDYHVGRLNTLNRLVVGKGIVRGLEVQEVTEDDDGLEVTVGPGVALDGEGNLIVVDTATTERWSAPTGDRINLYLTHDEASKDQVPVPASDRSLNEDCEYNRILETYALRYQDPSSSAAEGDGEPPGHKKPATPIEFPARSDVSDDEFALVELANQYHRDHLQVDASTDDTDVFLGSFENGSDGWEEVPEMTTRRPHVYTNDMLYDVLVNHVTDQENPHDLEGFVDNKLQDLVGDRLKELVEDKLEDIVGDRLHDIGTRLDRLEAQKTALERYVITDTLESKITAFSHVSKEFDSGTADVIVEQSRTRLRETADGEPDREGFIEFAEEVFERETALQHEQDDKATSDSMERYATAVAELERVLDEASNETAVVDVAAAQKKVCKAAASLTSR